jgi:hypothetical protein
MSKKALLAKMMGLSGFFGSVIVIGMRVVSTAAKKMLWSEALMSPVKLSVTRVECLAIDAPGLAVITVSA